MAEQETVPTRQQTPTPTSQPTQAPTPSSGRMGARVQLKRAVQQMSYDDQAALLEPSAPVQRDGGGGASTEQVHQAAEQGIASGGGAMPHAGEIQKAFGSHDISGIQAHTGAAAQDANAAMGAEAYATGNHVAFGNAPDLHTAAHEAAHVIQQEHGVSLGGGVGQVGDSYENHADKVADKVVKGESAEGVLSEMTGGAAKGGDATQQKKVQQLRADNVQMDVTSSGGPPAGGAGGGPPPVTPPAPPDPETAWRTYCDTLEAPVKVVALTVTADKRDAFKGLNPVDMRTYANAAMTPQLRIEMLGFSAWQDKTAMTVMLATPVHFDLYKTLAGPPHDKFRSITPDERGDLTKIGSAQASTLLSDDVKLNEWRTLRNVQAVAANPSVLAALGVADANDTAAIATALATISAGKGGERMRRLIAEQGFENPADKDNSIKAIRDQVKTANVEPFKAMTDLKANWVLKGKLTKNDGQFKQTPIMKAVAHTAMLGYGTIKPAFIDELITAGGKTPDAASRAECADPSTKSRVLTGYFRQWKGKGGVFDPATHIQGYTISGGPKIGAYWMFSAGTAAAVCNPAVGGQDIIKICAIEESPAYNDGFVIVSLPVTDPNLAANVRRPTMWDGLDFDQFAGVDDPNQCFGVTSGGAREAVVAPTQFSACKVERNVPM